MKKFLSEHKSTILRGFFELLIIFAGITISLLIDDWRQKKAEEDLAMQYMKSLYRDTSEDLDKIYRLSLITQKKIRQSNLILYAMHFPDSLTISESDFRLKFGNVTKLENFITSDNTFRDLTNTGNMKLITDINLKDKIYNYYRALEELNELYNINNEASSDLTMYVTTNNFSVRSVYNFNSMFIGADSLQKIDLSFFNNHECEKYLSLENLLLFRNIFLSMQKRKLDDIMFPLMSLRKNICELTNIPTIEDLTTQFESENKTSIEVFEQKLLECPDLKIIEGEINAYGYVILNESNRETVLQLFLLAVHLYPESANAYDSLGEIYFLMNDLENAKLNYQKSLELDPESETAPKMLKKIEAK